MMPLPIVEKIGQASKDSWPEVQAAIEVSMRTMSELAGIADEVVPHVEAYVAKGKTGNTRRRKICEETIWALANLGWLRTGPEREVILAARAWVDLDHDMAHDEQLMQVDDDLVDAVRKLPEHQSQPNRPQEVSR